MTAEELELLISTVCEHHTLKGSVLAQIEFVGATVEQARAHKNRVLATGDPEQMEAAGQHFEFLSSVVETLPRQLEELERRIAEGRATISAGLAELSKTRE
ncbi:MAG TPA: hypothetical protein VM510_13600 [Caulifigura sp.]|jgi:hypothetical protein|nr:hypothetical protein [Caulifigura sp.]